MRIAILIDGGFYRRRADKLFGKKNSSERIEELLNYCKKHISSDYDDFNDERLYRIFYYDCPPMNKKVYHPLLKKDVDFSETDLYVWMSEFIEHLKKQRKVAVRLGKLADTQAHYSLRPKTIRNLCDGTKIFSELTEKDFSIDVDQKGVDMKIGIDIASLAYKKQVDRIVLISGDSDFVPAAKLARREGIDFILDSMCSHVKPELHEHIDGLITFCEDPSKKDIITKKITC